MNWLDGIFFKLTCWWFGHFELKQGQMLKLTPDLLVSMNAYCYFFRKPAVDLSHNSSVNDKYVGSYKFKWRGTPSGYVEVISIKPIKNFPTGAFFFTNAEVLPEIVDKFLANVYTALVYVSWYTFVSRNRLNMIRLPMLGCYRYIIKLKDPFSDAIMNVSLSTFINNLNKAVCTITTREEANDELAMSALSGTTKGMYTRQYKLK